MPKADITKIISNIDKASNNVGFFIGFILIGCVLMPQH